jgi:sugar phosphate isomerase/epimerase
LEEREIGMPQPRIGVSMLYTLGEPFSKMLRRLSKIDTKYAEIVDDGFHTLSKRRVAALNEAAKSLDMTYTVHCPFADINIASPSKPILNASLRRLKQSMAHASNLDAELWVLHPGLFTGISPFYPGREWKQNVQSIQSLAETAREYGLRVAIENVPKKYGALMKTPRDFTRLCEETKLEIGIVLDVGHANLENQTDPFLTQLPDRITHLHLSDNIGEVDQHLGIGYGKIDWQDFTTKIRHIDFKGIAIVESVFNVEESFSRLKQLFT